MRINLGCGSTPTAGWTNLDNSLTVRLSRAIPILRVAQAFGLVSSDPVRFARIARSAGIRWVTALRLPYDDNSADVIYSSHMLEHLARADALVCLAEIRRVLTPGGIVRIVVPDLHRLVQDYLKEGDADVFLERTLLAQDRSPTVIDRLKRLLIGGRGHAWMYDAQSLMKALTDAGFVRVTRMQPGETSIADPGELDLREREQESVYVEAVK